MPLIRPPVMRCSWANRVSTATGSSPGSKTSTQVFGVVVFKSLLFIVPRAEVYAQTKKGSPKAPPSEVDWLEDEFDRELRVAPLVGRVSVTALLHLRRETGHWVQ